MECVGVGRSMQLSERDRALLAWCGEQYTVRTDLLAVLMATASDDPQAKAQCRLGAVVLASDAQGKTGRTAVEVELARKTEARGSAILRQLLRTYDDVAYRAAPGAATAVERAAAALPDGRSARVRVRPYPPPTLA